ncbi:hypothetical protein GQ457_13G006930 [Hibiscus cannabinus]
MIKFRDFARWSEERSMKIDQTKVTYGTLVYILLKLFYFFVLHLSLLPVMLFDYVASVFLGIICVLTFVFCIRTCSSNDHSNMNLCRTTICIRCLFLNSNNINVSF